MEPLLKCQTLLQLEEQEQIWRKEWGDKNATIHKPYAWNYLPV